jgi:ATP-dependent RNA helicase SUPV3L1/SUV3
MGEALEVREYQRLSPLSTQKRPVVSFAEIQPGDCVVAFSRKSLFHFKKQIEAATNFRSRVCIVYGGLPPETRKEQARLFNDQANDYDVLVASDAIGMGELLLSD